MKIIIFSDSVNGFELENHIIFANAFLDLKAKVYIGKIDTLCLEEGQFFCQAFEVSNYLQVGDGFGDRLASVALNNFDLAWIMNQPPKSIEKDMYQLLWALSLKVSFVNSIESLVFMNNKNVLSVFARQENLPTTYISNDPELLYRKYAQNEDIAWIAKPTNDGCGASVFFIKKDDSNTKVVLQTLTGNAMVQKAIHDHSFVGYQSKYAILQHYIPTIATQEKRVVFVCGEAVACYSKQMAKNEHRANALHGGKYFTANLDENEKKFCEQLGKKLIERGINYAGIDMAYPYLIELNLVNPGGLDEEKDSAKITQYARKIAISLGVPL